MEPSHETNVDEGIAVKNMTELVGHHALKLVAVEMKQRAPGDADYSVFYSVSGGKSVDAGLPLHDINIWHRDTRGYGHLLHHIEELFLLRIQGASHDQSSPKLLSNPFSSTDT